MRSLTVQQRNMTGGLVRKGRRGMRDDYTIWKTRREEKAKEESYPYIRNPDFGDEPDDGKEYPPYKQERGIWYELIEGIYYPMIEMDEEIKLLFGKYSRRREKFLREWNQPLFRELMRTQSIKEHLVRMQREAEEQIERIMRRRLLREPHPDLEKEPEKWESFMQLLFEEAESEVMRSLILADPSEEEEPEIPEKDGVFPPRESEEEYMMHLLNGEV